MKLNIERPSVWKEIYKSGCYQNQLDLVLESLVNFKTREKCWNKLKLTDVFSN